MKLITRSNFISKFDIETYIKFFQSEKSLKMIAEELNCSLSTASEIKNGIYRIRSQINKLITKKKSDTIYKLNTQIDNHVRFLDLIRKELDYLIRIRDDLVPKIQEIERNRLHLEKQSSDLQEVISNINSSRKLEMDFLRDNW